MNSILLKNKEYLLLLVIAVLCFSLFKSCNNRSRMKNEYAQNVKGLNEKINSYKDKNGQLIGERAILISDRNGLKDLNKDLSEEVDYWKKKKQRVEVVVDTRIEYRDTGSTKTVLTKVGRNEYKLNFDYQSTDTILKIKGYNNIKVNPKIIDVSKNEVELNPIVSNTYFTDIEIQIPLKVGIKEEKGGIKRAYVKTPNDKFKITKIDAVEIDDELKKSKRRFGVGPFIGYGLSMDRTGVVRVGPSVGVSVHYSILRF